MTEDEVRQGIIDHKNKVKRFISTAVRFLTKRAENHDNSKLQEPEFSIFVKYTPKLKTLTYGSEEYKQCLQDMKPALDHHYSVNRHHPDGHENGIDSMDLIEILEMLCDWKAATLRHEDGDILKSIEINTMRYGISPQLKNVLLNSLWMFE